MDGVLPVCGSFPYSGNGLIDRNQGTIELCDVPQVVRDTTVHPLAAAQDAAIPLVAES